MGATYPAGITRNWGETLALTTTLASLGMPTHHTKQAIIYNPSVNYRFQICPALLHAYVYDYSQSAGSRFIDVTVALQDRAAVGTGTSMDSMATTDRLLLCFSDIVGGIRVDVGSANGTASDLTPYYWNGALTALTDTDGTDTGAALAQDGNITWTAPTDAIMHRLDSGLHKYGDAYISVDTGLDTAEALDATETDITMDADPSTNIVAGDYILIGSEVIYVNASSATGNLLTVTWGVKGSTAATHSTNADTYRYEIGCPTGTSAHWLILSWSAAMDSDTEISNLWALSKDANRGYYRAGVEYQHSFDRRATGAIEALLAAGTDTLQVTWIMMNDGG